MPSNLAVCTQLPAPSHASVVHAFPSSVHALPLGFGGFEHEPVDGSQVPATWQSLSGVHTTFAHLPPGMPPSNGGPPPPGTPPSNGGPTPTGEPASRLAAA